MREACGIAAERMSHVREELTAIQNNLGDLHKAIDNARDRFRPVLNINEPPQEICCKENNKELVPLALELREVNRSLNDAIWAVKNMTIYCEL